jgi:transitional endoplasmic reticulum ATPase
VPPKQVRTQEAYREDVGRGVVRIDEATAGAIGVSDGDVISIVGNRKTYAKCRLLLSSDTGREMARFDGLIRNNAGVHIGDLVEISPAKAVPAEEVTIAPLEPTPPVDERYFTDVFEGYPLSPGDNIMVPYFGGRLTYQVLGVKPGVDVVLSGHGTTFSVIQKLRFPGYSYVGGLSAQIAQVRERVELPLLHPEIYEKLGIQAPQCLLLIGQTGVGKTYLMRAIANELGSDERTKGLKILWAEGTDAASQIDKFRKHMGAKIDAADIYDILFIDNLDLALTSGDEPILPALISAIDNIDRGKRIVAAARNPSGIDSSVRRRFSEIIIPAPDKAGRLEILQIHSRHMPLAQDVNLDRIAETMGKLVGAEIERLCSEAGVLAVRRWIRGLPRNVDRLSPEVLDRLEVTMEDFAEAGKLFNPKAPA